jgi:hypothetical protein
VQGSFAQPLDQWVLAKAVASEVEVSKRLSELRQNLETEHAAKAAVEVEKRASEVRKVLDVEYAAKKLQEEELYHRRVEQMRAKLTARLTHYKEAHMTQIRQMKEDHEKKATNVKVEHEVESASRMEKHADELRDLRASHKSDITKLKQSHQLELELMEEEIKRLELAGPEKKEVSSLPTMKLSPKDDNSDFIERAPACTSPSRSYRNVTGHVRLLSQCFQLADMRTGTMIATWSQSTSGMGRTKRPSTSNVRT